MTISDLIEILEGLPQYAIVHVFSPPKYDTFDTLLKRVEILSGGRMIQLEGGD